MKLASCEVNFIIKGEKMKTKVRDLRTMSGLTQQQLADLATKAYHAAGTMCRNVQEKVMSI